MEKINGKRQKADRLQIVEQSAGRVVYRPAPKETVLGYSILLPGPTDDPNVVVAYDIETIMKNREKAELTGDLRQDLVAGLEWGTIKLPASKVERWLKQGRLIKRLVIKKRSGKTILRDTYCEPAEWQARLTEEEQFWLNQVIEIDKLQTEEKAAKQTLARIFADVAHASQAAASTASGESRGSQAEKPAKRAKKHLKRKDRLALRRGEIIQE